MAIPKFDPASSSALKAVLPSKRSLVYYLEYCRVLVSGGCVEYVTDTKSGADYRNIPIANTTVVLLGTGTSITQAAVREMARAGVMLGFCGSGGTPLVAGMGADLDIGWFPPQSEYRPTEFLQRWASFWFDDKKRLEAAKDLQKARTEYARHCWALPRYKLRDFAPALESQLERHVAAIDAAKSAEQLLATEGEMVKRLYGIAAAATGHRSFVRIQADEGADRVNRFLTQGNYLAYGLAATALWVLGIPHSLALLHGKTRRGALVFDVADVIKDAIVLPCAFRCASQGMNAQEFREWCLREFQDCKALEKMFSVIQGIALTHAVGAGASAGARPDTGLGEDKDQGPA